MGDLSNHFDRSEFACRCGCGFNTVDAELIRVLEDLRAKLGGHAVAITSGNRCSTHNKAIGGAEKSKHCLGKAADIQVNGVDPKTVYECLNDIYNDRYGIGLYDRWVHIDVRKDRARWGLLT